MTEPCPLCGDEPLVDAHPNYVECHACGTIVQVAPPPSPFGNDVYAHAVDAAERRWLSILEDLCPAGRLLDLGCGSGGFAAEARAHGWDASGVEREESLVRRALENGLAVEQCDLDTWEPRTGARYDVVRAWFVLEHIRQPGRLLRHAASLLPAGGLLVVGIPNDAGWLSRRVMRDEDDRFWEHPLHLNHFPPFGLERWIEQLGFAVVVAEAGRPTELMRGGTLPLRETWERTRAVDPSLSRLFYQLGVGRTREVVFRKHD